MWGGFVVRVDKDKLFFLPVWLTPLFIPHSNILDAASIGALLSAHAPLGDLPLSPVPFKFAQVVPGSSRANLTLLESLGERELTWGGETTTRVVVGGTTGAEACSNVTSRPSALT